MSTYLFTWNPDRYDWQELSEEAEAVNTGQKIMERWSSGVTRRIQPGDRAFMLKLGKRKPKGIMGSGVVTSDVFEGRHWDLVREMQGIPALYVNIKLDVLLDPDQENILLVDRLDQELPQMNWHPQSSGTKIPDDIADKLERIWAAFLGNPSTIQYDQGIPQENFREGSVREVTQYDFERNERARRICIEHYGMNCQVCGMNFQQLYGEVGRGFIEVHHLVPLSEVRAEYTVDPINDLRPVCPNCHAMLHRSTPPMQIEELREKIQAAKR